MQAYAEYLAGNLEDRELDQQTLDAAFAELPRVAAYARSHMLVCFGASSGIT